MEAISNIKREDVGYEYFDWPKTTIDSDREREWVHPTPPLYYLVQIEGKWIVVDRSSDFPVTTPYGRKSDCVRAFIKQCNEQQKQG